jgi:hypothetical protein
MSIRNNHHENTITNVHYITIFLKNPLGVLIIGRKTIKPVSPGNNPKS